MRGILGCFIDGCVLENEMKKKTSVEKFRMFEGPVPCAGIFGAAFSSYIIEKLRKGERGQLLAILELRHQLQAARLRVALTHWRPPGGMRFRRVAWHYWDL